MFPLIIVIIIITVAVVLQPVSTREVAGTTETTAPWRSALNAQSAA